MAEAQPIPDLGAELFSGPPPTLGLSLHSHLDPPLDPDRLARLSRPHRTDHYFLMFVDKGTVAYTVDLKPLEVSAGQVLFVQPQQVRQPPLTKGAAEYFKITFDRECLALLPRSFRFWLDPWSDCRVTLAPEARPRVTTLLELLRDTVRQTASPDLVLAYLNAVLTEIEAGYFAPGPQSPAKRLEDFLRFQAVIEARFVFQPSLSEIAATLGMSDTTLYTVVKEVAGIPPKEYLSRRLLLEAQRRLFYSHPSVKELALQLGFKDENYLSRFFRRRTGKSITEFLAAF